MPQYRKSAASSPPAELPPDPVASGEVRVKCNPHRPKRTLANHLFLSSRNVPWLRFFESEEEHEQEWTATQGSIKPQFVQDQIRLLNLELAQRTPRRVLAVLWDSDAHFMPSIEFQYRAVRDYVDANSDVLLWDGESDSVVQMVEYFDSGISPRSMEYVDFVLHYANDHTHIVYPTIAFCEKRNEYLQLPLVAACKGKTTAILDHSIDTFRFPEQLAVACAACNGMRTEISGKIVDFGQKVRKSGPRSKDEETTVYGLETEKDLLEKDKPIKATEEQRNFARDVWRMARQTYQPMTYDPWTVKTMKRAAELARYDPYNNSPSRRQCVLQIAYDILFNIGVYQTTTTGRVVRALLADIADNGPKSSPPFSERRKYVGVYRHVTLQSRQDQRVKKLARLRLEQKLRLRKLRKARNYDPVAKAKFRRDRYEERIKIADRIKRIYANLEFEKNGEAIERLCGQGDTGAKPADGGGLDVRSGGTTDQPGNVG